MNHSFSNTSVSKSRYPFGARRGGSIPTQKVKGRTLLVLQTSRRGGISNDR